MSTVTASSLPVAQAQKPPLVAAATSAGTTMPLVRSPLAHIEFRSLLRESPLRDEALPRDPRGPASPLASTPGPAPSPSLAAVTQRPGSADPRSAPGTREDVMMTSAGPRDGDPLDPFARHHAAMGPPDALRPLALDPGGLAPMAPSFAPAPTDAPSPRAVASLEDLLPSLVRRVAFSGDGRRGTMRLEIGAGRFAGSTLLVHADGGRVRVHVDVPPGVDASGLHGRIAERLRARGIAADAVEVT
ncbi:MAG TPA: hypothetical protein VIY73_13080 [Polyangiaceae bacterium]